MTVLPVLALEDDAQQEALDLRGTFTTMTRDDTARWPMFQLALLAADQGDDRIIVGLGTVTRSYRRVATGWHRLRYTSRAEIEPIAGGAHGGGSETVPRHARGPSGVRRPAERQGGGGDRDRAGADQPGRRTRASTAAQRREPRQPRLRGEALQAAAQEADAVRLAVDIADIPRRSLQGVRDDGELPFLARLEEVRTREDAAIAYDSMRFLDFTRLDHPAGVVQFRRGHE